MQLHGRGIWVDFVGCTNGDHWPKVSVEIVVRERQVLRQPGSSRLPGERQVTARLQTLPLEYLCNLV